MISTISTKVPALKIYSCFKSNDELENLSKVNIFIGSNNSGKSRFLRTLFAESNIKYKDSTQLLQLLNEVILNFKADITKFYTDNRMNDYGGALKGLEDFKKLDYLEENLNLAIYYSEIDRIRNLGGQQSLSGNVNRNALSAFLQETGSSYLEKLKSLEELQKTVLGSFKFDKIYIPTLRGLRNLNNQSNDLYLERTLKDYFLDKGNNPIVDQKKIFTGTHLYENVKKLLLGPRTDREKIKEFENFLSKSFFEGKEFNIISSINDDVIHVRIEDEEFPIHQLGDGIQSIIILVFPLFMNQGKNLLVFIEEPENYLHPGYQRILIETLFKKEFSSFQFFITSHSNHVLDITLDIENVSVYTFSKKKSDQPNFLIENVDNADTEILTLIGARNSSVFLSNCTIWVEGITDRIYLRKYLDLFQETKEVKYFEDTHFSFVEYGGGNITHWSFLDNIDEKHSNILVDRLCGKLFLVSDKDGADYNKDGSKPKNPSAKFLRHIKLKENLKDRYYLLNSREIENTLPPNSLIKTIQEYEKSNPGTLNFKNFEYKKYKEKPLGSFIDENVENKKRNTYAAKSGTINDKVTFAKRAITHLNSFNELTQDAKKLTQNIYRFIKENNS